jgi:hypothetical protein
MRFCGRVKLAEEMIMTQCSVRMILVIYLKGAEVRFTEKMLSARIAQQGTLGRIAQKEQTVGLAEKREKRGIGG